MSAPEALSAELSRRLREAQLESRLPSVSAAAFHSGAVVWAEAIGLADVDASIQAAPDTQYRVGSITKTFTAAAVMALRDQGVLQLDDALGEHVPEAPHRDATLRRLLSHGSGLQREFPGEMWERMQDLPRGELLSTIAEAEQVLEPATYWHYSNLAFALLGEVVERRSGMPWETYLEQRFLQPLGLDRTTLDPDVPYARGYFVDPYQESAQLEEEMVLGRSAAAGQLWSTTADLARWGSFLCDPDPAVLSPATVEEMHLVQSMAEPERWLRGWGLGVALYRRGDRILAGHGGAMPGHLAYLLYSRVREIGVVVLANSSVWDLIRDFTLELAERAIELLPPAVEPWRPEEPAPPELAGLLGRWWTEGSEFVLRYRRGRLEARMAADPEWQPPAVFEPDGDDRFRVASGRERGEVLRVIRDEEGEPIKLYWATYPCTRTPQLWRRPN